MALSNPLLVLGLVLLFAVVLGDASERIGAPWISGCIVAGVCLGPDALGLLSRSEQSAFGDFLQASLALIAFNIGCRLTVPRLSEVGRSAAALAILQLAAPMLAVLAALLLAGYSWPTAVIAAAVAPATAPTTTYAVVQRRQASGPFVDRLLAILAINDAATMLVFSVVSAATVAWIGAPGAGGDAFAALRAAAMREGSSVLVGALLGGLYLLLHSVVADGRPGSASRLRAMLYALLLASVGAAVEFGFSSLLTPLALGVVIANGAREPEETQTVIGDVEEPLYMVFFVLAGAHLPAADLARGGIAVAGVAYILARFAGKYGAIFLGALALRLDAATRRYLGLCFPSQGGLAMGLALACAGSAAVRALPPGASGQVDAAVSIVLLGVLVSQVLGPIVIDFAVRRAAAAAADG
ncbi:cation:proton antiporter [Roseiarcus fermentans]|nr:cation:proton antiporter [Roseiarcus fermentans]